MARTHRRRKGYVNPRYLEPPIKLEIIKADGHTYWCWSDSYEKGSKEWYIKRYLSLHRDRGIDWSRRGSYHCKQYNEKKRRAAERDALRKCLTGYHDDFYLSKHYKHFEDPWAWD